MFGKKTLPPERSRPTQQAPQRAVFSYHANRAQRPGPTTRDRFAAEQAAGADGIKRAYRLPSLKRAPQVVVVVIVAALLVLNLHLDSHPKVVSVESSAGQVFLRAPQTYEAAAQQFFGSAANSNKVTINTSSIAAALRKQFPELQSVSVSLPVIGSQPVIYIQPATPKLVLATQSNGLYVLDTSGRALILGNAVPSLSKLKLPLVTDESSLDATVGDIALPRSTVAFIDEIVYQLKAKGVPISSLTLPAGVSELHMRIEGTGYYVKYNLYGNAREEAGAYLALMKRLNATHIVPKEYVDVRVEQRVYYK